MVGRLGAVFVLLFVVVLTAGCGHKVQTPLPLNAVNATDAQINADLQGFRAGLARYEADVKSGLHTPTANEKVIVNKMITSLNTAEALYQSYHKALVADATAGEPAALVSALADLKVDIASLQTLIKGVTK